MASRFPVLRALLPVCLFLSLAFQGTPAVHIVLVSVDGLMPSTYTAGDPTRTPTLQALAREGAYADGVVGVLPSVTYASHTTLITGVPPAVHGIYGNSVFDPEDRSNSAWYWYARAIKVPTLLASARARGLSTGAISWPVTVGLDADYVVPEYWRPQSSHPSDAWLLRALSSPGLLDDLESARKAPFSWPFTDQDRADMAAQILVTHRPRLLALHLLGLDSAEHSAGPGSPKALEVLQQMDGYVRQVREAIGRAGIADRTYLVIVSDHGFAPIRQQLQPNALFRKEGLLEVDAAGKITGWQAYYHAEGGAGFVYLRNPDDQVLAARVARLLETLAADPANGIASVWTREELARLGADPAASFGVGMKSGFYTTPGHDVLVRPTRSLGGHGFDPRMPELHASLIIAGPETRGRGSLGVVRMTQIAPTLAGLLDVPLSPHADSAIELSRAKAAP
jgi:predicted AlkP superfamily pyrophosphatase or phosphodiesterase